MNSRLPRLAPVLILIVAAALIAPRRGKDTSDAANSLDKAAPSNSAVSAVPTNQRPEPRPPTNGDKLIVQATAKLEQRDSISARLRHQIAIGGNQLYGVGSYWQQGSGEDLRVRLELQIAGQDAKLLHVSNGRFLWIERQLATGRAVTRINLRQLRADPALMPADIDNVEPGEATWTPLQPDLMAHCGGLPSLLAALGESFSFLPPQPMRLAAEPIDGAKPTSIPVYAVVGHWKPDRLAALISESQGSEPQALPMASLPERLPQEVLLLVGQADLFPYRVEYRRLETPDTASDNSSPIPYQLSANPIVVLELSDVAFDVPIAAGQFDYSPGNADWIDQTAGILERLRHRRRTEVAVHAGGDGPK